MVTSWPTAMAPPSQSRGSDLPPNQAGSPGFLGPNGAGKSTTMRVILGLHVPSAGRATIGGRPYARLRRPLHQVGALLDAGAAHGGRTARNTGWPSPPATGSAPAASTRYSAWSAPPTGGSRVLPGLKQRPLPAGPVGSSCASGTRNLSRALATSVGRGSLACGLWMRYHAVGAATLAPRSGVNDLITLQNWWSGAGSNRRPSLFRRVCSVAARCWVWPDKPSSCTNHGRLSPDVA